MTSKQAALTYIAAGVAGVGVAGLADGTRCALAAAVAWGLCTVVFVRPPRRPRVAVISVPPKISSDRQFAIAAMPFRMMVVILTAAVLYSQLRDRLGFGFWFAILAFYLLALALSVARTLTDLRRTDSETWTR